MAPLVTTPDRAYRETLEGLARRLRMSKRVARAFRIYAYQHPTAPSLFALRWAMGKLGVRTAICRVEALADIPLELPCVAQCEVQGEQYLFAINSIAEGRVNVYDRAQEERGIYSVSEKDFAQKYTGFLLVADDESRAMIDAEEPLLRGHTIKARYTILLTAAAAVALGGLMAIACAKCGSARNLLLQHLLLVGITLSWFLLRRYGGLEDVLTQKLCGIGGKQLSCPPRSSIRLPWGFELPEVAIAYFTTLLSLSLLNPFSLLLNVGCLIGVIFVPFSIYYQHGKHRQWCMLCLGVDVTLSLLGAMGGVALADGALRLNCSYLPTVAAVAIGVALAIVGKIYVTNRGQYYMVRKQFALAKYSAVTGAHPYCFPAVQMPTDEEAIVNRPQKASSTVVFVLGLQCSACQDLAAYLGQSFGRKYETSLAVVLPSAAHNERLAMRRVSFLRNCETEGLLSALQRQPAAGGRGAAEEQESIMLLRQQRWCETNGIHATPTLCIDGRRLPAVFTAEDIDYICI